MQLSLSKKFLILLLILFLLIDVLLLFVYFSFPKPGRCLILEEKYCQKGTVVYYREKPFAVGFSLPKNTPVFSPFDGLISPGNVSPDEAQTYPLLRISTGIKGPHIWEIEKSFSAVFSREKIVGDKEQKVRKGQIM